MKPFLFGRRLRTSFPLLILKSRLLLGKRVMNQVYDRLTRNEFAVFTAL